ncbi:hypothetical protein BCR35DRAFT_310095 [Leucosporidium creatinivorum]|uniref:C3H1-type domain-containing protein n=1 Tax=Leucosporidium creatinivorum TaxID=106004 RepID=A0A1Y2D7Y8_9BASI|nr:hypothetical protein BCR35DRAFT_310095 [Leucosporidium creatinivorum]
MSFHSNSSQYASSNADSDHSSPSTAPSSIHACADSDEEHFEALQRDMGGFVQGLIKRMKKQEETEILLRAWSTRCETLEGEVLRLDKLVKQLEAEKAATAAATASKSSPTSALHARSDSESSSSSTQETFCVWSGKAWIPKVPVNPQDPAIPQIDPSKSMSKQDPPPCNSHYLAGGCSVPRCKFSHLYKLTPTQLEEMRRGALFHLCNSVKQGIPCEDITCCYGHTCPRGSACGRNNCAFNDEQHKSPPTAAARPSPRRR